MPTIIDTLLVKMELDPTLFTAPQKEAGEAFLKTREAGVKAHKEIEAGATKVGEALGAAARQALSLFAVFIGGRGIKEWLAGLARVQTTLRNLAFGVKTTEQDISAWGMLSERLGGKAADAQQAFRNFSDSIQALKSGEQSAVMEPLSKLFGFSGVKNSFNIKKSIDEIMLDVAEAAEASYKKDPERTVYWLKQMQFSTEMARILVRGRHYVSTEIAKAKRLAPTPEDLKLTEELRDKFVEVQQILDSIGNSILAGLAAPLSSLIEEFREWLQLNRTDLKEKVEEGFHSLAEGVKSMKEDWDSAWEFLKPVWTTMDEFVQTNIRKGWIGVFETLMELAIVQWVIGTVMAINPVIAAIYLSIAAYQILGTQEGRDQAEEVLLGPVKEAADWINSWFGIPPKVQHPGKGDSSNTTTHEGGGDPGTGDEDGEGASTEGPDNNELRKTEEPIYRAALRALKDFDALNTVTGDDGGGDNKFRGGLRRGHGGHEGAQGLLGSVKPVGKWWTAERRAHAIDRLMKEGGLSEAGAAGLVARWSAVEAAQGPGSRNPNSGAEGIGQWLGSRKQGFTGDFDSQISHAIQEGKTSEARAWRALRDAKTPAEGSRGASMFERAEHYHAGSGTDDFTGRTPTQKVLEEYQKRLRPRSEVIGAKHMAAMEQRAIQQQTSNDIRIAQLNVDASGASDAEGIASRIHPALQETIPQDQDYTGQRRTA